MATFATAAELIPTVRRGLSLPGGAEADLDDAYIEGSIRDGFWVAKLDGLLTGYTEEDGNFTPPLEMDAAAIVRFYAIYQIQFLQLMAMETLFRAQAGPVEFETQRSAQLLRDLFAEMNARKKDLLDRLSADGRGPADYVGFIDAAAYSMVQPWRDLALHGAGFDDWLLGDNEVRAVP